MQLTMFDLDAAKTARSSAGRMCPESSTHQTTPSVASLARLPGKIARSSRQGVDGRTLVVCLDPREQSRGGSSTPNISDCPNDAAVCSLSQVLETGLIQPNLYLSPRACAGFVRRDKTKRGAAKLPAPLHEAMKSTAASFVESMEQIGMNADVGA